MYRNPAMPSLVMREAAMTAAARAGFDTPEPVYVERSEHVSPQRLSGAEQMRAMTAMHHARRLYPEPVAEVLRREIEAYKDLAYTAGPSAPVVRLIDHLMSQHDPSPERREAS